MNRPDDATPILEVQGLTIALPEGADRKSVARGVLQRGP
jgi:hypothetical protein